MRFLTLALAALLAAPVAAEGPIAFAPLLNEVRAAYACAAAGRGSEEALKVCFDERDFGPYRGIRSGSFEAAYRSDAYNVVANFFLTADGAPSEADWAELVAYIGCIEQASYEHPVSRGGDIDALTRARAEVRESCLDYRFASTGEPWFDMPELDTDEERMAGVASELARRTFTNLALVNGWIARAQAEPSISVPKFAALWMPAEGVEWSVCRNSQVPSQARIGAINTILGRPDIFRLAEESTCDVMLVDDPASLPADNRVYLFSCILVPQGEGRKVRSVRLAPNTGTPLELQKCLFRLGLWIDGRAAMIGWSDAKLFVPTGRSRWQGLGPTMPQVVPVDAAPGA